MTVLFLAVLLQAQEGTRTAQVPNAMGAHTWFIILAVGGFLAWCISYSLQLHKEAMRRKKGREDLLQQKEAILNQIIELEDQKDDGSITEQKYKQELKSLKFRLAKLLEKL